MEDIALELLASLRKSFAERIEQSSIIDSLYKRIESGSATYAEAEDFAYEVGKCLAETFKSGLSSAVLPDGKMYYNIADRVIRPLLSDDHTIVSDAAAMVQKSLNKSAGIGLQVKKPKINEDRVAGIIDKVSGADQYDDVAWVLDAPVVNFSQSVVDEMLKGNVEFHGKAGLTPKIIRKAERKCCKWCKGLAGEYEYPDVPHDVYRRHENCRCAVLYDPADGSKKRQNFHSREWTDTQKHDKINKRKQTGVISYVMSLANHPRRLASLTPGTLKEKLESEGFEVKPLKMGSLKNVPFEDGGGYKVNFEDGGLFQYHPATRSHHGGAYYKISTGKGGTHRYDLEGNEIDG